MFDKRMIYFFAIAEEGSFSAAAKRLFISQPALSYQISSLEEELGVELFDRKKNRAVLNEVGKNFYQDCKKLYEEYNTIYKSLKVSPKDKLRIGSSGAYENRDLLNIVSSFVEQSPNSSFSFKKNTFEGCLEDLLKDKVDVSFGIECTYKNVKSISYEKLFDFEVCIIVSDKNHLYQKDEVTLKDLENEEFVLLNPHFGHQFHQDVIRGFMDKGFKPKIKKYVNSLDEMLFEVSSSNNIGFASEEVVYSKGLKAVKLKGTTHSNAYVIAYNENNKNELISEFKKFAYNHFNSIN